MNPSDTPTDDPDVTDQVTAWLSDEELAHVRDRVPQVYVQAVPVRIDHLGQVTHVGLLLRAMPDGSISRAIVSGRVMHRERVREALWRHLCKDLGSDADPQLPPSPAPFTVAEYLPDDDARTGFHDPRQHAVALVYVVPVTGECQPSAEALDFSWIRVGELADDHVTAEMANGHERLIRMALAHAGRPT